MKSMAYRIGAGLEGKSMTRKQIEHVVRILDYSRELPHLADVPDVVLDAMVGPDMRGRDRIEKEVDASLRYAVAKGYIEQRGNGFVGVR